MVFTANVFDRDQNRDCLLSMLVCTSINTVLPLFRKYRAFIKAGVPIVYPANVTEDQQWMAPAKFIGVSQKAYWDLNGFECDGFILLQFRHKMVIRTLHEYLGIIFYAVIGYI